jgi:hypothetical protein
MPNEALYHLLFIMCAPQSTIEFHLALVHNAAFATPPHGFTPTTSNWKCAYQAYLMFFQLFEEIYNTLTQNDDNDSSLSPDLKSKPGNIGLMQIINEIPPNNIGIRIAAMLNQTEVKKQMKVADAWKSLANWCHKDQPKIRARCLQDHLQIEGLQL